LGRRKVNPLVVNRELLMLSGTNADSDEESLGVGVLLRTVNFCFQ
jgi:hypothetical protein